MVGTNAPLIKKYNRALIMTHIFETGTISRTELSKVTGLSKGGITPIINDLLNLNLIDETKTSQGKSGRKPLLLKIKPDSCSMIAVDWTRDNCITALVDPGGNILDKKVYSFTYADTPYTIINKMHQLIHSLMDNAKNGKIIGIGIVAPGPINRETGYIYSPPNFHGWSDIPIMKMVQDEFPLPVFLENNANAYGGAEKTFGLGRKYKNFISLIIDEGIGSAIIINRKLYKGNGGFSNEIGHISIDFNGAQCSCGNTGCLELYASIPKILEQLNHSLDIGAVSPFFENIKSKGKITWDDFVAGLKQKDILAKRLLQKEAVYIGNALVSAINLLEPEAIFLSSKIARAGDDILKPLIDFVQSRTFTRDFQIPEILVSEIDDASISGGAAIVFEHFINGELGEYEKVLEGSPK